jgi:hypothetical protein
MVLLADQVDDDPPLRRLTGRPPGTVHHVLTEHRALLAGRR